ncbi:related to pisatin demethylase [Cephalotrichum gorgonifer]|uniref:Cytochrome P450 monooxygenase ABA1 n=1 Tax=Cephalotrichum gorgonifer TaxID=2041049 RepID=A0AAE8MW87_9PEZI|nr:related to pisatin demethylase [Cephalotrichum gorgonifer]
MGILAKVYEFRWALVLAGVGTYVARKLRAYLRLRAFKGPPGTGFFGLWHSRALISWESHRKYREVIDQYGPIARIGPRDLITSSPDLWMHMSAVRSLYSRAPWYPLATRFQAGKDHIFSQVDEEKHKNRRRQLVAGYSGKEIENLEGSIDTHIAELLDLIRSKYLSSDAGSKPMDFAQKMSFLTLDIISHISFGKPFGDIRADGDVDEFLKAGEEGLWVGSHIMAMGLTGVIHTPWVFRTFGPSEKDKTGLGRTVSNARKIIEERYEEGIDTTKKSDMIGSFMKNGLDKEELITEAVLQIIAGSDTTATTLKGTMLYLLSHPRVYAKLQKEVDEAVRSGAVGSSGIVSDVEVKKLPYLQAVIKEGIRIHPPVTDEVPKCVPDGGDVVTIDGTEYFLPGGAYVGIATLSMYRRKDIFGDDVEEFRPERWLPEEDERKLAVMNRVGELVFGYGKYQCLGMSIAHMEIGKILFELMRNFDLCLANPEKPWREVNYGGLYMHSDMWVLVTGRNGVN